MKIRLSLFCIAVVLCAFNVADAQQVHSFSDGANAQPAFQQVSGDLLSQPGFPGRMWFEANLSDNGLGYNGSYLTVGGKTRLFEDRLDGRWVVEGQSHFSLEEDGGFFANIGIERVFSIPAAESDVTVGFWYDYNGDRQTTFSHEFHQVAASASIKTRKFDLIGNGYFPIGEANYTYGDLSGADCFVGNDIVIIPGIDSALKGFDVALRFRPKQFAFVNGTIDIGGYQYSSDTIDAFAGGTVRFGMQFQQGMIVNIEVNQDDRFNTTGVLGFGWLFGANASGHGHEYSQQGRDLEQTVRNNHVVVFNQEVVLATDPDTGLPYDVIHVDNTADPTVEDGTAETPFSELLLAEGASDPSDVIVVHGGDGTDFNMDQGITLQNDQRLWGIGDPLLIPIAGGEFFELCTDPAGTPTISNAGGTAVVTLADNNDVAGLNIDATGATFGILGTGVDSGSIRSNTISNATLDGVFLTMPTGDWTFSDNTFADNGRNGLFILDALDTTSDFLFDGNTATGNGQDGIMVMNYDPATISFVDNVTSNNVRNGLYLENYLNSTGGDVMILRQVADGNAGTGVFADIGSGDLTLLNSSLTNNSGAGFRVRNWATVDPEAVLIGITEGGVSDISSNGALANVEILLDDPGIHTRALVTGQTLNTGVRGLAARVEGATAGGVRSTLDIDIIDNISINGNLNDGIDLTAIDGALIRANIGNSEGEDPLAILDNAAGSGDGISLLADGADPFVVGTPPAEIIAMIDNVTISNQISQIIVPGTGVIVTATDGIGIVGVGHSVVDVTVTDSTIGTPANTLGRITQNGVRVNLNNNGSELINKILLDDITVFGDIDVSLVTGPDTYTDFVLQNSDLLPAGVQSIGGVADNTPFTDALGSIGLFVSADGSATVTGVFNMIYPNSEISFFEQISDGDLDNLTSVSVIGNTITDFTFEGIDVNTTGDAQMLLSIVGNNVSNNGAGNNNDANNNNVFNEQPVSAIGDPDNLFFFDGVDINAFDDSQISTRITGNTFLDNFERGLSLNTFNMATINAEVNSNVFARNDRGFDVDLTNPPIGVGTASGFTGAISTAGFADFEAINNEEFYFRNYESLIFINPVTGAPQTLGGMALPANSLGVAYPGNNGFDTLGFPAPIGFDIFGFPVAVGTATMNLAMSSNTFQSGVDLQDFAEPPGDFTLGLDGLTNGFTGPFFGITDALFPAPGGLIDIQETFFGAEGF